jgi:hypothetical protein
VSGERKIILFNYLTKKPISSGLVPWVQNPLKNSKKRKEKNSKKIFFLAAVFTRDYHRKKE